MYHPSVGLATKQIYWIIRCVTLQLGCHKINLLNYQMCHPSVRLAMKEIYWIIRCVTFSWVGNKTDLLNYLMCHPSVGLAMTQIYWIIWCVTLQLGCNKVDSLNYLMCHPSVRLTMKEIYWNIRCVTLQLPKHAPEWRFRQFWKKIYDEATKQQHSDFKEWKHHFYFTPKQDIHPKSAKPEVISTVDVMVFAVVVVVVQINLCLKGLQAQLRFSSCGPLLVASKTATSATSAATVVAAQSGDHWLPSCITNWLPVLAGFI